MPSRINLKLTEIIRQRAAHVILHELKDPRMGFVTVTRAKLAPDNSACVIFWSVIGRPSDRSKTMHALDSARPFIQRRVAEGLHTRTAPQLSFEYDESVEGAIKMGEMLKKLRDERGDPVDAVASDAAQPAPADASAADAMEAPEATDESDDSDEPELESEAEAEAEGDAEPNAADGESSDEAPPRR